MNYALSTADLHSLAQHRVVGPFEVYSRAEIDREVKRLRASLMNRKHAVYDASKAGNISNYDRHLDVPFLANHIRKPQIVDRVSSILGADTLCWRTEFFVKYPGDEGTDWHQSRNLAIGGGAPPLLATEPHPTFPDIFLTLSVWTALTDSTRENGCLQVIPGTQKEMRYDDQKKMTWRPETVNNVVKNGRRKGFFGYDSRESQVESGWTPDENSALDLELKAGQCVILWEATMHGSLPNTSRNSTRMAFVARYVPTQVQVYSKMDTLREFGGSAELSKWRAVLVSGVDNYRHNRLD